MPRWTVHLEGGPRRVNHAAILSGDRIYSFGGYCTGEDYETRRPMDVHMLNTVSYRWTALPVLCSSDPRHTEVPYQRYGHTAVNVDDEGYIWGGRNDVDGACNQLYKFSPDTRSWSRLDVVGPVPGARDGHSACVIRDAMYIFGGYEEKIDRFSNEVYRFLFIEKCWEKLKILGSPARWRDFHSATGIGDVMYVFGGRSDRGGEFHTNQEIYCDQIQLLDTRIMEWHEPVTSGLAPQGRRSHSAFVYGGHLYIFGGYNGLHEIHFDDLYKFNPDTFEWSVVKVKGQKPCPRRRQCCLINDHKVFVFGGTSPSRDAPNVDDQDLMDHSDLHVLDFSPSLKTLCLLTVVTYKLDGSWLPKDLRVELAAMTTNSTITRPLLSSG